MASLRIADRMPPCIGHYEGGDPECDGSRSVGADLDEVLPCLYRDRCAAFAKLLGDQKAQREDFVALREVEHGPYQGLFAFPRAPGFVTKLDEQIVRYDISAGRVTNRSGVLSFKRRVAVRQVRRLGPQSATHRARLRRTMLRRLENLRKRLELQGWYFVGLVAEPLQRPMKFSDVGARPEELFWVDRLKTHGYGALYYRLRRFHRKFSQRPVVRFYPRIRRGWAGSVELQVACPYDEFMARIPRRDIHRFDFKRRTNFDSFGVAARDVQLEQVSLIAYVVRKLATDGHFGFGQ